MEEHLKEKLRQYQPTPDPAVWDRISHTLRRHTLLRRGALLLAFAAGIAVAVSLFHTTPVSTADSTDSPAAVEAAESVAVEAQSAEALVTSAAEISQARPVPAAEVLHRELAAVVPAAEVAHLQSIEATSPVVVARPVAQSQVAISPAVSTPAVVAAEAVAAAAERRPTADDNSTAESDLRSQQSSAPVTPVVSESTDLRIPNVFAPADADPVNRTFRIAANTTLTAFKLFVYNRGGRLVYHTTDINAYWDGTHNGTDLPQGAYVYVIYYSDPSGTPHTLKGTVTLLR